MDNLVLWFTSDYGGCGHLRSLWPNEILNSFYGSRKMYDGISTSRFIVDNNILRQAKIFHFQRQISKEQLAYMKFIRNFRDNHKKDSLMIYDFDDRFLEIPEYNYSKPFFSKPIIKENFIEILSLFDIVTVTTEHLAEWARSFEGSAKVVVVPNYIPKYIYRPYDFIKPKNEKPKVIWAGSMSHFSEEKMGDFEPIMELITNTVNDFEWFFIGFKKLPKWISHIENKVKVLPWNPIVHFPSTLKKLNIDIGLAPLLDNDFNKSKSNIKFLDYASSDIITIGSNIEPYKDLAMFLKNDWKENKEQILDIFNNKEQKNKVIDIQNKYLSNYWLEEHINDYMNLFGLQIGGK